MKRLNLKIASKKIGAASLLFIFISSTLIYPATTRAQGVLGSAADCVTQVFSSSLTVDTEDVAGVLGREVPVEAKSTTKAVQQSACKQFFDRLADIAARTALNVLKKRILDAIVDQTINWIQGGGEPRFITDFGGFLDERVNEAVGDVVQQVGLGAVCQPFRRQLLFQLEQPGPFSQQVSCTLDQIVDNIENFYEDFSQGGWIAYNEIYRPRNNQYGALLITLDEQAKAKARAEAAATQEAIAGQGFRSTEQCLAWTRYAEIGDRITIVGFQEVNSSFDYPNPTRAPQVDVDGSPLPSGSYWTCSNRSISTPGQILAGSTQKAIDVHTDNLINADDLTQWAAAIIDAGINRLIREGVRGLRNIQTRATSQGYSSPSDLPAELTGAGDDYTDSAAEQTIGSTRRDLTNNLTEARDGLSQAETKYNAARAFMNEVVAVSAAFKEWCDPNRTLHPQTCALYTTETLNTLNERASSTRSQINAGLAQIEPLRERANALLPEIQSMTSQNVSAVTESVTALIREIDAVIIDANNLKSTLEDELSQTQNSLSNCRNPNLTNISCP